MSGYVECLKASANVGFEKSQQRPPRTLLRCAPCLHTRSHSSWLQGEGREQMGRDLLQSHTKAMTKLRQEGRVTSCSVHPRCTTGTVPAAAASNYLQLLRVFWEGVSFPFGTGLASARWPRGRAHGEPEHRPRSLCSRLLQQQAQLGRFPLETHKSIYQWRLETSEGGEVKLALNEPIKPEKGETRLRAEKASPGLCAPGCPCSTCSTG